MAQKKISLIRGTGFKHLDGSLVTIVEQRDDGLTSVVPFGSKESIPIMIDSRCIQEVDKRESFTYEFRIEKYCSDGYMEFKQFEISDAFRSVPLDTIIEYLETNLKPILRME